MKKVSLMILLACLFISSLAQAKLSCNELDELAEILDDLAEELVDVRSIGVDGDLDLALGDLTDALNDVARVERDKRLSSWINDLETAWEYMERDDFEESLDDIIERLDDLYDRDCERDSY